MGDRVGSAGRRRRVKLWCGLLAAGGLVLVVGAVLRNQAATYSPPRMAYSGDSAGLKRTVIVPTLDTPMPPGHNVIWCASFQLAWNRLRDDVIGEPIRIANAEAVAGRLNAAGVSEGDLPAGSFYAAAGEVAKGIRARILSDMARKFPRVVVRLPEVRLPEASLLDVLMAYAYLEVGMKFPRPYFAHPEGQAFVDSNGRETKVAAFGFSDGPAAVEDNRPLCEQVGILYAARDPNDLALTEFALDLCRTSRATQLILACLEPNTSLARTYDDLERKIAAWKPHEGERAIHSHDRLAVPAMNWEVDHHFTELEGLDKVLLNTGRRDLWIRHAFQGIRFRLDRSGVALASDASILLASVARDFSFTRPFLLVLRKRGAEEPFFVMWVDNAELLSKASRNK